MLCDIYSRSHSLGTLEFLNDNWNFLGEKADVTRLPSDITNVGEAIFL